MGGAQYADSFMTICLSFEQSVESFTPCGAGSDEGSGEWRHFVSAMHDEGHAVTLGATHAKSCFNGLGFILPA